MVARGGGTLLLVVVDETLEVVRLEVVVMDFW